MERHRDNARHDPPAEIINGGREYNSISRRLNRVFRSRGSCPTADAVIMSLIVIYERGAIRLGL